MSHPENGQNEHAQEIPEAERNLDQYHELNDTLKKMSEFLSDLKLKILDKDKIFTFVIKLVQKYGELLKSQIQNSVQATPEELIDVCNDYICVNLKESSTRYRRDVIIRNTSTYVEPVPFHLQTYWDTNPRNGAMELKCSQCQIIPITETLASLFSSKEFEDGYFDFNNGHVCQTDVYSEPCCAENYRNCEFFNEYENAIQIQWAIDDFEPASELKSKANVYKTCMIYGTIRNLPIPWRSKSKNYFVVAICYSNDMKDRRAYNAVWEQIIRDINELETEGIETYSGKNLRGTLINITFDNLGGSQCFGFAQSFNITYYCRICKMPKHECQITCIEKRELFRSKDGFDK